MLKVEWDWSRWTAVTIFVIALLACRITFSHALSIEPDQQFTFAQQLYQNGQYRRAAEEYQRFAFFFPDEPRSREALYLAGDAFFNGREIDTALGILIDLSRQTPLDAVATKAFFLMAECYLHLGSPSEAQLQLHNLVALSDNEDVRDRAYFRMGWIHIEQMDWAAAQRAFDHVRPSSRLPVPQVTRALAQTDTIPQKNPALAGTLSIVPGAGQLYCARYQDALAAFLVNVGLIWAAVDAFDQEQYALGGLLSFVGAGFYTGNIYSAISSAHKYNLRQNQDFIDHLKQNLNLSLNTGSSEHPRRASLCLTFNVQF